MVFKKCLLAALTLWTTLLAVLHQAHAACFCTLVYYSLCDKYDMADVVVHGAVLSRNVTGDDATYVLDTITSYKEEDSATNCDEISFNTPASSDDCGVTLTIGEEYLVGLIDSDDDGVYTVVSCHGLYELWSTAIEGEVTECS